MSKVNLNVRVTPETRRLADLAAEHDGAETTSSWVRRVLHRHAIRTLEAADGNGGREGVDREQRERVPA